MADGRQGDASAPQYSHPEPAAVDAAHAGRMVGLSRSAWLRLHARGLVPEPLRLGRRVLWSVEGVRRWVAEGCPRRGEEAKT